MLYMHHQIRHGSDRAGTTCVAVRTSSSTTASTYVGSRTRIYRCMRRWMEHISGHTDAIVIRYAHPHRSQRRCTSRVWDPHMLHMHHQIGHGSNRIGITCVAMRTLSLSTAPMYKSGLSRTCTCRCTHRRFGHVSRHTGINRHAVCISPSTYCRCC